MSDRSTVPDRAKADQPAGRLIVALDLPTVGQAEALAERLSGLPVVLKIGHQLAYTGGLALAGRLIRAGHEMFLDLKLHDIPRTVEEGVRSLAGFGARFITVHAYPQTMRAAVAGRGASGLAILGVSVLTSMSRDDLHAAGYSMNVETLVERRSRDAVDAGVDGLVCAGPDLARLPADVAGRLDLVVPGIRPAGSAAGDQKRVMTPAEAIRAGADYLVVGRPVTGAADPLAAARAIVAEIGSAGIGSAP